MARAPEAGAGEATLVPSGPSADNRGTRSKNGRVPFPHIRIELGAASTLLSDGDGINSKAPLLMGEEAGVRAFTRNRDFLMGRMIVQTTLENGTDSTFRIQSDALVDTGAAYLTLPSA